MPEFSKSKKKFAKKNLKNMNESINQWKWKQSNLTSPHSVQV